MLYERDCNAAQINVKVVYTQVSLCWEDPSVNASVPILKEAAGVTWDILDSVKAVKGHKKAFHRLAYHAADLIVIIWRSYTRSKVPQDWLSPQLQSILQDLLENLNSIFAFVNEHISMNIVHRLICSADDMNNIQRYHGQLKLAIDKFEVQSHISACRILTQILKKQERLSDHIQRRNETKNITSKHSAAEACANENKRRDQTKPKRQTHSIDVGRQSTTATVSLEAATTLTVERMTKLKKAKIAKEAEEPMWDSDHQTEDLGAQPRSSSYGKNHSDEEEDEVYGSPSLPPRPSFSFTNSGGGVMINKRVGNTININTSNAGNNRSENYYY